MGSRVNVCHVDFLTNPSSFTDEFQLEITFEVFEHLPGGKITLLCLFEMQFQISNGSWFMLAPENLRNTTRS